MARHLYIAGVDRYSDLVADTLQIEQILTQAVDSCSFRVRGIQPEEGREVRVEDDALGRLFGGVIDKVQLVDYSPDKTTKVWQVDCQDFTYQLDRKLVVETYENMAADLIVKDIITKYGGGVFTINHVQSGAPVVEKIIFDYRRPSECLRELAEYIAWDWYVDYSKDIWFFNPNSLAQPAPMSLEPGGYFRNVKHSIETTGLRNRVYVRGGTMLSDPWTYEVKADGSARAWVLPHKPHDPTLTVGGVAKTVGIEYVDDEATKDFLMNFQEKYVRCSAQTPTPAAGTTLSFTYRYDIDVITMVEDIASQQAIAKVQGGDGVYEHVIVDDSLTTIDAAEAAGMADLREHANPRVKGSFETEVPGWAPGQLVTINLPDRGITGTFLVQKVTITPCTPEKWTYRVEYGGRLLGIADWLQALWKAQQKKKLNETALLHKFHYGAETAKVTDEVQGTLRTPPWVVEQGLEVPANELATLLLAHLDNSLFVEMPEGQVLSFSRSTVAYNDDGTQVAANTPRYKAGKYNNGVWIEEGTQNLLKNASFEVYTGTNGVADGWNSYVDTTVTASYAVDTTVYRPSGLKSQKVAITASTDAGIAYLSQDNAGTAGATYTTSVYVQGSATGTGRGILRIRFLDSAGTSLGVTDVSFTPTSTWQRIVNTATAPTGTATIRVELLTRAAAANDTVTIYWDDAQLEAKSYPTSIIFANDTTTQPSRSADNLGYTLPKPLPVRNAGCLWWKPTYGSASLPSGKPLWLASILNTAATPTERYRLRYNTADSYFGFMKYDGTTPYWLFSSAISFNAGDVIFIAWLDDPIAGYMKLWVGINGGALSEYTLANTVQITDAQKVYWGCGSSAGYECDGVIDDPQFYDAETIADYENIADFVNAIYTSTRAARPLYYRQLTTVGSLMNIQQPGSEAWAQPQYRTSTDGITWSAWQGVDPVQRGAIEVPYPGYVRLKANGRVQARNWKKPFDQTDVVCGFVMAAS